MNVCVHILFQDIDKNLAFCKGRCQVYNGALGPRGIREEWEGEGEK